jgi:hydroxymethylbilane synthase
MGLHLKVGTRQSPLALWQAEWAKSELLKNPLVSTVELVKIKTSGDKILDVPLAKVGGKGLFTKEIEEALLRKDVDLAVHSLKDVPTKSQDGLEVRIITERENPFDALVSGGVKFADLPKNARIGTSSLRRRAQLKKLRPDFQIVDIRGNVQSRMNKMKTDNLNAVILAAAGMIRLGFAGDITEILPASSSLPAVGQGALAIETRVGDETTFEAASRLHHAPTAQCVAAERAFLKKLEGGCQAPIAGYCVISDDSLTLEGLVCDLEGTRYYRESITGRPADGVEIGVRLAEKLLKAGAAEVLDELYHREN